MKAVHDFLGTTSNASKSNKPDGWFLGFVKTEFHASCPPPADAHVRGIYALYFCAVQLFCSLIA